MDNRRAVPNGTAFRLSKKSLIQDVIANQLASWCGDPLNRRVMFQFYGEVFKIREITTPVCGLARNDMVFRHAESRPKRDGSLLY